MPQEKCREKNQLFLTEQIHISVSYTHLAEEYTMNLNGESGAKVSNDDYQSLIGYAGFHYGKKFGDNVAYLRVAAAHEFAGDIDCLLYTSQ